jgi:nitroreductase
MYPFYQEVLIMKLNDLADLIKGRRSIRKWQDKDVPDDLLLTALELATWAPNGGNQQNWHFHLVKNREIIGSMADKVQEKAELMASWPEAAEIGSPVQGMLDRAGFFRNAPVVIVVTTAQYQSPVDKLLALREENDAEAGLIRKQRNSVDTRIQSVSSVIAYLLLVLHRMGLGAVWMTGPMQAKEEIEKILKIPENMDAIALIPVGYPDESPDTRGRKPVEDISSFVR